MKKIVYFLPLFVLLSCGGNGETETEEHADNQFYEDTHELIVSAKELKEKFASLQASFAEIGNKEVEETICYDGTTIPYNGNEKLMNVWVMSTYLLDNFSSEEFGKHNFSMPDALIREETPLSELNWLNINSLDTNMFEVYKTFPELKEVPKSNEEMLQKPDMVLNAMQDGLLAVLAITDYLPPKMTDGKFETGYVMGYIMFANWEKGSLSCISPLLAQNNATIDFEGTADEVAAMNADLQQQTFTTIDSIAKSRTAFGGPVKVMDPVSLASYKD
ncbi:hypothetical protein K6119_11000 [Paracrocinitomix mangrovi]|uniref:hypothetical protein n=1 Tax=Paracrocinitomix mangrovi TaxID=2862509 RepID=UPI001C8E93DE|nr:hypothetical protein [Paracrocinitomix mangrovi]UKN00261.1 hypothetical protein K6119_11000 [Paracrocinitomix mangrovi]